MFRKTPFTLAIIAAFGIALAPAPAVADRDDVAKIIAGLAIAGVVAKIIDDRNDRNRTGYSQHVSPRYNSFDTHNGRPTINGNLYRHGERKGNRGRGFKQAALPDRCLRTLSTVRGNRQVYARKCLKRNYAFANKLPNNCKLQVRTDRGLRTIYGRRCLAQNGWQVAGRR